VSDRLSYQAQMMRDPNVQLALDIGWKYKLDDKAMHDLTWFLHKEQAQGRIKHDEHRKQVAAKWAKARAR
jgi:hypothetical protein